MNIILYAAIDVGHLKNELEARLKKTKTVLESCSGINSDNYDEYAAKLKDAGENVEYLIKLMSLDIKSPFLRQLLSLNADNTRTLTITGKIDRYLSKIKCIEDALRKVYEDADSYNNFLELFNVMQRQALKSGSKQMSDSIYVDELLENFEQYWNTANPQSKYQLIYKAQQKVTIYKSVIIQEINTILDLCEKFKSSTEHTIDEYKQIGHMYITHVVIGRSSDNTGQVDIEDLKRSVATIRIFIKSLRACDTRSESEKNEKINSKFNQYINELITKGVIDFRTKRCRLSNSVTLISIINKIQDLFSCEDTINYNSLQLLMNLFMLLTNDNQELSGNNVDDATNNLNDMFKKTEANAEQ